MSEIGMAVVGIQSATRSSAVQIRDGEIHSKLTEDALAYSNGEKLHMLLLYGECHRNAVRTVAMCTE
ncbi:hypothetical protein PR048_013756 [Dryococelus australis]|uniref:Uncharacterized protein n=1 Tax=Dryococelus australis TaxID=614101 RepID=A0ABQ9HTC5_9NEOP|nr:hypothetical protein PR048_013756 [Dryococelus australis]